MTGETSCKPPIGRREFLKLSAAGPALALTEHRSVGAGPEPPCEQSGLLLPQKRRSACFPMVRGFSHRRQPRAVRPASPYVRVKLLPPQLRIFKSVGRGTRSILRPQRCSCASPLTPAHSAMLRAAMERPLKDSSYFHLRQDAPFGLILVPPVSQKPGCR